MKHRPFRLTVTALLWLAVAAAVSAQNAATEATAIQVREEIAEELLIDVGVQLFDPGLSLHDPSDWEKKRIFPEVRKSEARYLPVHLMETLQATGQWGAVRVVPSTVESFDLTVGGQIVESSGKELVLDIRAVDVTGNTWLERRYKDKVEPEIYQSEGDQPLAEPFQELYNRIANDLLEARRKLSDEELLRLRRVAQLKFAANLAPYVFADYLGSDRKGRTTVERLPADGDPMIERVQRIRDRDDLFVDTLTEHYSHFAAEMTEAYDSWRMFSYEEQMALEKLRRKARTRKILGVASIIGGILIGSEMDQGGGAISDIGIFGGVIAIQSGIAKSQEAQFHAEALNELAASFDSEIEPLLIDVEGQTLKLQGSLETQYTTWRQLLRDLFVSETGVPVDPNSGAVTAALPAPADEAAAAEPDAAPGEPVEEY